MKKLLKCLIAALLSAVFATQLPIQAFAKTSDGKYMSEIKLGIGNSASEAEAALAGYEILKDAKGKNVDLNRDAGTTNIGGKGNRVVYLGYTRTNDSFDAITDLSVMNMQGGYSVPDYEALMDKYRSEQIIPFVEDLLTVIKEYRQNYNSENVKNSARARHIHDQLNKLTDDDCGGAGLGDLLLNATKYEMGDDAYNALSASEKNKHADIVTIVEQSNGQATLIMQNLLLRAADTGEDTWIDRFANTTYDDLLDETGMTYSKAKKEVNRLYYDDAIRLLDMWDTFKTQLDGYDDALKTLDEEAKKDFTAENAIIGKFDPETASDKEIEEYADAVAEVSHSAEVMSNAYADILCHDYLESVKYEDGTLVDLFTMPSADVESDITMIYPFVAALSDGQRAGLEFVTLQDLVMIGATDENGYNDSPLGKFSKASIYENVDREIYKKDNVALTSDSLRSDIMSLSVKGDISISPLTYIFGGLTVAGVAAFGVSLGVKIVTSRAITAYNANIVTATENLGYCERAFNNFMESLTNNIEKGMTDAAQRYRIAMQKAAGRLADANYKLVTAKNPKYLSRLQGRSTLCSKLAIGFGVAIIILTAITTYMTYRDLMNRYNVSYTPIPRYMVDEKDIIGYNANGDRIVLKNQAAYYKAALCNRKSGDSWYKELGDVGDLNGTVGREWLALYAEKNEMKQPILADSLFFTGSSEIPAGYQAGIHLFGSDAVLNLNSSRFCWNGGAPDIYVYYKFETARNGASLSGSVFSPGTAAIFGIGGMAVGAAAAAIIMTLVKKKKTIPA